MYHLSTVVPSGPPTNVQLTQTTTPTPSANLTWGPPTLEHQNGIIIGYVVTVGNLDTGLISSSSTSLEQFVLSSLTPDSQYRVKVAAQTSAGSGPYSEVITLHIDIGSKLA